MNQAQRLLVVFFVLASFARLPKRIGNGFVDQSTITYHVSHPLHQTEGVSHDARGKGVCHAGQCDFLDRGTREVV